MAKVSTEPCVLGDFARAVLIRIDSERPGARPAPGTRLRASIAEP